MKRIITATSLFLVALIICLYEFKTVGVTESYKEALDKIITLSSKGEFEKAHKLSLDINNRWQKTQKELNKYLYHDYVDSITLELNSLTVYTQSKDSESIIAISDSAKIKLASLKESELPYIYNIL